MVRLSKILENVKETKVIGSPDIDISGIAYDSRDVKKNHVFVALKGLKVDGHNFITNSIETGARCIVLENEDFLSDEECKTKKIVKVVVKNSAQAMALMANSYYDYPTKNMKVIGITGTNGKTTISYLIKSILELANEKIGLMGTINYRIGSTVVPASKTTPESVKIFNLLDKMRRKSVNSVVMEVSSHSLALNRVYGLDFDVAAFTNLTQDHLDFHKNIDDYFKAKKILFDINLKKTGVGIYNSDDLFGKNIVADFSGEKLSYGLNNADVSGQILDMSFEGMMVRVKYRDNCFDIKSSLTGRFNAYNILTASAVGLSLNINAEIIKGGIEKIKNVSGRFQKIKSKNGFWAIVDYSHTPDSLYNALVTVKQIIEGSDKSKIITVFGCGGNRDKTKRPLMGKIASDMSDKIYVTSDNPRDEEPQSIIEHILEGIKDNTRVVVEMDRKKAIEAALAEAKPGDIVLVAGKGHENYQDIKGIKYHFDDSEIIKEFFAKNI
jgi:UDP-N-acetylmuramoyl-L-alanyl-D-glutamate--2,6-diaminopimelate ligase